MKRRLGRVSRGNRRKGRKKRAVCLAALWYCASVGLVLGILRAAQQTKQVMHGGNPVLAEVVAASAPVGAYEVRLGGGEWVWVVPQTLPMTAEPLARCAEQLPPGVCKWLLRGLVTLSDAVTQTTERVQSTCSNWVCSW